MYFGLLFILYMISIILVGFIGLVPGPVQVIIPFYFRFIMFFIGMVMGFMGIMILYNRSRKVGANELIAPGRPGSVLWFFFYRDGELRILPSKRAGEGQLYNSELDSQVIDVKTYSLCDHKIRIVPEVVGHAVDLDYVGYVDVLKTKHGFENLRQARESIKDKLFKKQSKEMIDEWEEKNKETFITGDENESLSEKVKKLRDGTPTST